MTDEQVVRTLEEYDGCCAAVRCGKNFYDYLNDLNVIRRTEDKMVKDQTGRDLWKPGVTLWTMYVVELNVVGHSYGDIIMLSAARRAKAAAEVIVKAGIIKTIEVA